MTRSALRLWVLSAVLGSVAVAGAQSPDPRVGLKPGVKDAGVAAKGMELVANVPKPPGFFDPKPPAPEPPTTATPSGTEAKPPAEPPAAKPVTPAPGTPAGGAERQRRGGSLAFANSDMAFRGNHLFVGNFTGYNIYDISNPKKPELVTSVVCPGGQGDMSVHGNLLFMSVEESRGRLDCGTEGNQEKVSTERFLGVRIFDISDIKKPKQIASVQTCRGSHTHTLLVHPADKANVYIYGSGTGSPRAGEELTGCSAGKPEEDPNTAYFSIDVIQVPLAAPQNAKIVNRPRIFSDPATGAIAGLAKAREAAPDVQASSQTNQCHDITVFPEVGLAAGACSGNGILFDISDPVNPKRLDAVEDKNFAYWHSATFNNDGTKVIFTDEWGGGTNPRCRATDRPEWGADAIFDIIDKKLQFRSYFKMPAAQTEQENCVAHNGSIVPVPGRDIMVQAWYQGGVSAFDFTDSAKPVEVAYFDRGPLDAARTITAGQWSDYWYNGHIYGTEMARGLDVFRLKPSEHLSENEIAAASAVRYDVFNPQQQPKVSYPSNVIVARAYLDQLTRGNAIQPERAVAVKRALDRKKPDAALAAQLEQDAAGASSPRDAMRFRGLAAAVKGS
jgi:hypothetical protein